MEGHAPNVGGTVGCSQWAGGLGRLCSNYALQAVEGARITSSGMDELRTKEPSEIANVCNGFSIFKEVSAELWVRNLRVLSLHCLIWTAVTTPVSITDMSHRRVSYGIPAKTPLPRVYLTACQTRQPFCGH